MRRVITLAIMLALWGVAPARAVLVYQRPATKQIVAARDGGSHPRVIAHGEWPVVSPDGRKVAFIAGKPPFDTALYVVSIKGGAARRLARKIDGGPPPDSIAWSPNSRFVTMGRIASAEYIVDLATGRRRAVELPGLPSQRAFSPDSLELLLEVVHPSDSEIDVIHPRDDQPHYLSAGEAPAWGADGFAYRDYQRGIVFRRGLDARRQRIHSRGHARPRDWSADGDTLLAAGGQYPDRLQALLIDRRTRATVFLDQRFSAILSLSRNGRVVLGEQGGDVIAAWRDGSTRVLAANAATPSWTK